MDRTNPIYQDLLVAQEIAYKPSGLFLKNVVQEKESQEYGACTFEMNGQRIAFRVGKTTPTKLGHFVTLWKRRDDGLIKPYSYDDPTDLFVVSVRNGERLGQFVFPKKILVEQGVLAQEGNCGKLAIRVYPSWVSVQSLQAKKTQRWQCQYFFEIYFNKCVDIMRIQELFHFV